MIKTKVFLFCLMILIINNSCEKIKKPDIKDIVINELMPVNSTIVADQNGEYDDWLELYNSSSGSLDISGYYLTDNRSNITKWQIPQGTSIPANGYLIIWADKDTTQIGLHANFKLSSLGEVLIFSEPDQTLVDEVVYPLQTLELSYSRSPNGAGAYKWQSPTFNRMND